jgi:hypothetical protein
MGMTVMLMGASGSGKSSSLRNFKQGEVYVFEVAKQELPFKCDWNKTNVFYNATYDDIKRVLSKAAANKDNTIKIYVIDDSQYLMVFDAFRRAKETGYGKYTDFAVDFESLVRFIQEQLPSDFIVYFLHHTEKEDDGSVRAKTIGKMLDTQLCVEGLFSIVLLTKVEHGVYTIITKNDDGMSTAKSPIGMFEKSEIPNDLKAVDGTIREYYKEA